MSVNVIGVNTTLRYTGGAANKMAAGLIDGRVKVWADTYVIGGSSETAGSTIRFAGYSDEIGYLPQGATMLAIIISASVAQTSATFSIGDTQSATRYGTGIASLGANQAIMVGCGNYQIGTNDDDDSILITTAAATLTAGTLTILILYTTD